MHQKEVQISHVDPLKVQEENIWHIIKVTPVITPVLFLRGESLAVQSLSGGSVGEMN